MGMSAMRRESHISDLARAGETGSAMSRPHERALRGVGVGHLGGSMRRNTR
jgi:hypothetical protein